MSRFKKVLFPTDFSESAEHALRHALRLVDVSEGEVIVQHVVSSYFEKHSHWATLFDVHEMQKYMDMYVDTEMARVVPTEVAGSVSFRSVVSEGRPAEQIVALADKERVDLVVMGPAKGVVTGPVIRAANHPVLAIPGAGNGSLPRLSKILVPTDCSPSAKKVVDYAFEMKKLFGCDLTLMYVIEFSNAIKFAIRQGHFLDASAKMREWAENQLENLTPHEFVNDTSVQRTVIEEGYAADRIPELAETEEADLVVMGAHGYGPVQRHFVGSTTGKVLSTLSKPLLTVRV